MSQPRGRAVPPAPGGDRPGKGQPAQAPALPTLETAGPQAGGGEPSGLVGDHVRLGCAASPGVGSGGSHGGPRARRGRSAAHARPGPGGRWMPAGPRPQGHTRRAGGLLPARGPRAWALTPPWPSGMHKMADAAVSNRDARTWQRPAELCLFCRADGLSLPGFRALQRQMEIFVDYKHGAEARWAVWVGSAPSPSRSSPALPPSSPGHPFMPPSWAPSSPPSSGASLTPAGPEQGSLGPLPESGRGCRVTEGSPGRPAPPGPFSSWGPL